MITSSIGIFFFSFSGEKNKEKKNGQSTNRILKNQIFCLVL